jgi:hypothetical protein
MQINRIPQRTLSDYLDKGDYMVNETRVKSDFVLAIFADIHRKLNILLKSQEKLLNTIRLDVREIE